MDERTLDGDAGDFALPDFLDLAGGDPRADFACSSTSRQADGGVLVFSDSVLIVDGDSSTQLPRADVRRWRLTIDDEVFTVTVEAEKTASATLPIYFLAATANALEAALGPEHLGGRAA